MKTVTRLRNWSRKRLNRELKAVGLRQADIARTAGRAHSLVSEVIAGKTKSFAVASMIAAPLGRHPHDIWPRLYAPPVPPSGEPMKEATDGPAPTALAS